MKRPQKNSRRPKATHVLVLHATHGTLFPRNGPPQEVSPDELPTLKARGQLVIVDRSGLIMTTFRPFKDIGPGEAASFAMLNPEQVLPTTQQPQKTRLVALDTLSDEGDVAVMIAYAPVDALQSIARLIPRRLKLQGIEPAVMTALPLAGHKGVVIENGLTEHQALLNLNGLPAHLQKKLARASLEERATQVVDLWGDIAQASLADEGNLPHMVLIGEEDVREFLLKEKEMTSQAVSLSAPSDVDLARAVFEHGAQLLLTAEAGKTEGRMQKPQSRWLTPALLGLGAVAAVGPWAVLSVQNQGVQATIAREQAVLMQLAEPLREHESLTRQRDDALGFIARARYIVESRADWPRAITTLAGHLPQTAQGYEMQFTKLEATATPAPVPAPPTAPPPDIASGETPAPPPPAPVPAPAKPGISFTLTGEAISRRAANVAITTFEQAYRANVDSVTRQDTGRWLVQARLEEK